MSRMFTNYDNVSLIPPTVPCFNNNIKQQHKPTIITNIKGEIIGVQVFYTFPFTLYFHLENFNTDITSDILTKIIESTTTFEVVTTTGKSVIKQTYNTKDILNTLTNDLKIEVSAVEAKKLKKETYNMVVDLHIDDTYYRIYSECDGYLIVR